MTGTKRAVVILIVALLAFGYVFTLNPQLTEFKILPGTDPIETSFALILFLFLMAGFGLAVAGTAFWQAFHSFLFWRLLKKDQRRTEAKRLVIEGRGNSVLGRNSLARRLLHKAQRKDPGDAYIILEAARVEIADGRLDTAERRLKDLLYSNPKNAEVLSLLLDVYRERKDFEGQVAVLDRWLEVDPSHLPALQKLRDLYAEVGNWSEAVRIQSKIVAKAGSRERRAEERRRLSEYRFREAAGLPPAQARGLLETVIKEDESFTPAHAGLGDVLLALGDREGAVQAWIRGHQATGKAGLLLKAEAELTARGRADEMLKLYRKLGKKGGKPSLLRARLLLKLERAEEALRLLEQESSGSRLGKLLMAEALHRLGSYDNASKAFREGVFGTDPDVAVAFVCDSCNVAALRWDSTCSNCGSVDSLRFQGEVLPPVSAPPATTR